MCQKSPGSRPQGLTHPFPKGPTRHSVQMFRDDFVHLGFFKYNFIRALVFYDIAEIIIKRKIENLIKV